MTAAALRIHPDLARALSSGSSAVVALESSVLAQGLPIPANREAADRMCGAVRRAGALPAITALVRGVPTVGLDDADLERFLRRDGIRKVAARDLAPAMAAKADGATTVAASLAIAHLAGIEVFATGGIGGVHRVGGGAGPAWDESGDLPELARTPIVVVCAGAKSILDLTATMERLETLGVTVVGYRTGELPGFFTTTTGIPVPARVESAGEVAEVFRAQRLLRRPAAVLVVQPPPAEVALPQHLVDAAVHTALDRAASAGVRGGAVTPYLLAEVERQTAGRSLGVNLALLEANAKLAAEIAKALGIRE